MTAKTSNFLVFFLSILTAEYGQPNAPFWGKKKIKLRLLCPFFLISLRACLHRGGGLQTCGGSPHLSCKRDQIDMRDCMDRWVTPPKRVTSPTWGPPPPCKQALKSKEVRWQRLPRRWSCLYRVWKEGFLNPHFHSLFTRNPASRLLSSLSRISFSFQPHPCLSFGEFRYPGVAVKSRIPSTFSRIPHCTLVKSQIPGIPLQTLLALCVFVRSTIK